MSSQVVPEDGRRTRLVKERGLHRPPSSNAGSSLGELRPVHRVRWTELGWLGESR